MKTNLFAANAAPKFESKSTPKDKEKIFVANTASVIHTYNELKKTISNAKTDQEQLGGTLKDILRPLILGMFHKNQLRPDSFYLCDGDEKIMVIPQDSYKKVEEAKYASLEAFPNVLETTTTYKFNADLLEEYGQLISDFIIKSKAIKEEDKDKIIIPETTTRVKKGTIDRLPSFGAKMDELFYLIEPTIALK